MSQQRTLELLRQAVAAFETGNSATNTATWQVLSLQQGPWLPRNYERR